MGILCIRQGYSVHLSSDDDNVLASHKPIWPFLTTLLCHRLNEKLSQAFSAGLDYICSIFNVTALV